MQSYRGSPGRAPNNGYQLGRKIIQLYIPAELKVRLYVEAGITDTPMATIVGEAIERELARRAALPVTRTTLSVVTCRCGATFERHGRRLYCSVRCRSAAYRDLAMTRRGEAASPRVTPGDTTNA